ncbi:nuclear apoptosis-inducing factor 1-like [Ambystoma mexicanum]|uniref:nuclear apoptosis-inducing factor 1-like n=1 Tax=Ambystoma mexicanum TaxID=8296 RepID=UPI0037E70E27
MSHGTPLSEKKRLWDSIALKVNAVSNTLRTVDEMKKCWYDVRRRVREKCLESKERCKGTGGGSPYELNYTSAELKVLAAMDPGSLEGVGGMDTLCSGASLGGDVTVQSIAEAVTAIPPENKHVTESEDQQEIMLYEYYEVDSNEVHCVEEAPIPQSMPVDILPTQTQAEESTDTRSGEGVQNDARLLHFSEKQTLALEQIRAHLKSELIAVRKGNSVAHADMMALAGGLDGHEG